VLICTSRGPNRLGPGAISGLGNGSNVLNSFCFENYVTGPKIGGALYAIRTLHQVTKDKNQILETEKIESFS
jgi:hypothetical protein